MTYKAINGMAPQYLASKFTPVGQESNYTTRRAKSSELKLPKPHLEVYRRSFAYQGASLWNSLDPKVRLAATVQGFKTGYLRTVLG